jgi:DNA-binding phage protein
MPLTRSFRDTVKARIERDLAFRDALLAEAIEVLLSGDVQTGKAVLRDYINATIGFPELSKRTGTPTKSLMRMFSPSGNPTARTLFAAIRELQAAAGVVLELRAA